MSATFNSASGVFYFGYYVEYPGVRDFLVREINVNSPSLSPDGPRLVADRSFVEPSIIKFFLHPQTRQEFLLILATNKLLMYSIVDPAFEIFREYPFNLGNRAFSMEIVLNNAILVGLNTPSEMLPAGTNGVFGSYVTAVPLVNDDDRWRGELLSTSSTLEFQSTAIAETVSADSRVEMYAPPVLSCGKFIYVLLRRPNPTSSLSVFVYNDYPIQRLNSSENVTPNGEDFVSATCINSEEATGILLLLRSSDGKQHTLFLDSDLVASPLKAEEEMLTPDQPNAKFVSTSLQAVDSTNAIRLIFGYDTTQPQSANGALLGFYRPNPDVIADILSQNQQLECTPGSFFSGTSSECVPCDDSEEALNSNCPAMSSSGDSLPAAVAAAIGIMVPFVLLFVLFLMYVHWKQRQNIKGDPNGTPPQGGLDFLKYGIIRIA